MVLPRACLLVLLSLFLAARAQVTNTTGATPTPTPTTTALPTPTPTTTAVPVPAPNAVSGNQQLVAFLAASRSNDSRNAYLVPLTFLGINTTGLAPAAAAAGGRRRQLKQTLTLINSRDNIYTASINIVDANGKTQGGAGGFTIRPDTGSGNVLVTGFAEGGLTPLAKAVPLGFGGISTTSVLPNEFSGTISFTGVPGTATANQVFFSVPPGFFGNGAPVGFTFSNGAYTGAVPPSPVTLLSNMVTQSIISTPAFTLALSQQNPVPAPGTTAAGGMLGLGTAIPTMVPALTFTDVSCAPLVPASRFGNSWTVAIQAATASQGSPILGPNTVSFCPLGSGCTALIDSGTYELTVPQAYLTAVWQLLGLGAAPATTVTSVITGRTGLQYAPIACGVQAMAGPTLDFQIQDRVYSLAPRDYILQYTKYVDPADKKVKAIPANFAGVGFPPTTGAPLCAVGISPTPALSALEVAKGVADTAFILGDPFMSKFPSTFFGVVNGAGVIASTGTRGVPLSLGNNQGGGNNGGAEEDICFYGTVPVKAVCSDPITFTPSDPRIAYLPNTCQAVIPAANLLDIISLQNKVAAFVNVATATQPTGPTSTTYTLQPADTLGSYVLQGGKTTSLQLTATTSTTPKSVDTCSTSASLTLTAPTAVCAPTLTLPATSNCAAQISPAALTAAIDAGSTAGDGGPLTKTLSPPAPATGTYNLAPGTFPVTLTVSNCAGTATCSTLVTVADQEPLDATKVDCNAPANGVVETPVLALDKTTPVATLVPKYAKANGCPVTVTSDNLSCRSCLLGKPYPKKDDCVSTITAAGVTILPEQIGRVLWTVDVADQAGHKARANCAICADHGDKPTTTLGHCTKPFTPTTPCTFGNL